ncbi:hypothetical protein, partial [Streptomyces caniscabiei]|uniref:hypothetical protein n=1 Tax=Streptomyces caniscabiei TaxID=2746961 RepID=UPI0038F65BDD
YRKEYRYIDFGTGEVLCKSKDPYEFMEMLIEAPAPSKLTRGDISTTGFEWLCGRLKATQLDIEAIHARLERERKAKDNMVYGDDEGANALIE